MNLLNKIQRELKAPKSQFNSFGKYYYRNCEDILEAVKPFLADGATLILSDEIVEVGGRCYVKATATLCEKEGTTCGVATAFAREPLERKGMDESQITGAASSYARKYALAGLFLLDDTKDADSDEPPTPKVAEKPWQKSKPMPKADDMRTRIKKLCDEQDPTLINKEDYEAFVEKTTGLKLEAGNFAQIVERLEALAK